jgi:integrase
VRVITAQPVHRHAQGVEGRLVDVGRAKSRDDFQRVTAAGCQHFGVPIAAPITGEECNGDGAERMGDQPPIKVVRIGAPGLPTFSSSAATHLEHMCLCCLHGTDARRDQPDQRCCVVGKCCQSRPSRRLVQQVHSVLRNALQAAVREELIGRNVAKLVKVSGPSYDVNRGLTADEARNLLAVARDDRLYALYVLALYLGLRRGELLGLRWVDIDLAVGVLEVRRALQRIGGELQAVTPKSKTSVRTVPLLGVVIGALEEHKARQDRERQAAGVEWVETGYVFTSKIGTPIEPDNLRRSWYPIRDAAGLRREVFHGLRHTCVTLLLDLGVPPHIVRDIVGHAAIEVTMTIYAHASLDEKRSALRKLDDHLR